MRFLSRYPVLLLVPLAALSLALATVYAAGLAGSWDSIHGAKTAAVLAGALLGLALAIAGVTGHRRGADQLLLLPTAVLLVGFLMTRQQLAPSASRPEKVTTGFEAAAFALCSVLWFLSAFAFLGLLPRLWRARMAFSNRDRCLHITRAPHWLDASAAPIPLEEWLQFAESNDDMAAFDPREPPEPRARKESPSPLRAPGATADGKAARRLAVIQRQLAASRELIAIRRDLVARDPSLARYLPPGLPTNAFAYERGDGSRLYLTWYNSEIVIAGTGRNRAADVARTEPIAWALAARLMDEDGTVYDRAQL